MLSVETSGPFETIYTVAWSYRMAPSILAPRQVAAGGSMNAMATTAAVRCYLALTSLRHHMGYPLRHAILRKMRTDLYNLIIDSCL